MINLPNLLENIFLPTIICISQMLFNLWHVFSLLIFFISVSHVYFRLRALFSLFKRLFHNIMSI